MSESWFIDSLWQLKLPNKWQGEHGEECATFYHTDGVGALQIQTFQKRDAEVSAADLQSLAADVIDIESGLEQLRIGDFHGFTLGKNLDGEFWRYWFVSAKNCALLITYNCDADDSNKESGVVLEILRSLKLGDGEMAG